MPREAPRETDSGPKASPLARSAAPGRCGCHGERQGEGFGRRAVTLGVFRATRVTEWPEGESLSVRGILPWDVLCRACHGEARRRKPRHSQILPWAVPRRRTSPLAGFTPLAGRSCRGRPRGRRNRGRKRLPWPVPRRKASPLARSVAPNAWHLARSPASLSAGRLPEFAW